MSARGITTSADEAEVSDERLWEIFRGLPLDHDSAAHYRGRLRHELLVNRCAICGTWRYPPKPICPQCLSDRVVPTAVSGRGTIFMAVFLHQGPPAPGVDYSIPYPVVTVELDEAPGLRFTSTVVGSPNEEITIGRRVRLAWIERGETPVPVFELDNTGEKGEALA